MRHGKKSSAEAGLSLDNFKISKIFFEHLTKRAILSWGAIFPSISNISEKNQTRVSNQRNLGTPKSEKKIGKDLEKNSGN